MRMILTPDEMRQADNLAITQYGIPAIVLMENAASSAADMIVSIISNIQETKVLILCGNGNNGGDGFAIARHLMEFCSVEVLCFGDETKMSEETLINFKICNNLEIPIIEYTNNDILVDLTNEFDLIIDALIGVGGSENIKGKTNEILDWLKYQECLKIAIDVPTGLNALTGKVAENCFNADFTITMFAKKTGLMLSEGQDKSGYILTADLGVPDSIALDFCKTYELNDDDIQLFLPERNPKTSKFDYGRVLVIAGSKDYPGAPALAANAAITMGAGLVELYTEIIHPSLLPEVIVHTSDSDDYFMDNFLNILNSVEKADSVVVGPGLGQTNIDFVRKLLEQIGHEKYIILDADAISALDITKRYNKNIIITPHSGEFSRLLNVHRTQIESDSFNFCRDFAEKLNIIIHHKNHPSITSDGNISFLTTVGNPGMATAGSGDVLSGIIGALSALSINPLLATALGAYIHARAGDYYVSQYDEYTLTASKIIENIKNVLTIDENDDFEEN